jgi:hypothetical protein
MTITTIKFEVDFRFIDFTNKKLTGSLIDGFPLLVKFYFITHLEQSGCRENGSARRIRSRSQKLKFENVRFKSNKKNKLPKRMLATST